MPAAQPNALSQRPRHTTQGENRRREPHAAQPIHSLRTHTPATPTRRCGLAGGASVDDRPSANSCEKPSRRVESHPRPRTPPIRAVENTEGQHAQDDSRTTNTDQPQRVRPTDEASNQASTRELSPRSVAEAHRHRPANAASDAAHSLAARQRIPMSTPADRGATTNRRCGRISTAATPNRLNGWVATARTRAASFKLTRRSGCPEGNHSNRSQNRYPYPAAPQKAPEGAFSETSVRDWTDQTHDQRTSRSVRM